MPENFNPNIIGCTTCKTIIHIKCIIKLIEKSSEYIKCPHCIGKLSIIFDTNGK